MKQLFIYIFWIFISYGLSAQVGINTSTPNTKSALDINSTTKGLLPPRMTEAQRDAITDPIPAGLQVWCSNCGPTGEMQVYDGVSWTNLAGVPAVQGPFTCGTSKVSFQYNGIPVKYGTVVSAGGRCWLDRNLGASQVATSYNDAAAYGDLFQWGRGADGHQIRTSGITSILSSSDTPGHGMFFAMTGIDNWRSPANTNLWQGATGTNNPCPSGFRLPTTPELVTEYNSWSNPIVNGAFASPLKMTVGGQRYPDAGALVDVGGGGLYWSSTVENVIASRFIVISDANPDYNLSTQVRTYGFSVRCIKDTNYPGSIGSLDCSGASIDGTLTDGIAASGVAADISYTNGNGASHVGQTVLSSGVAGLTATLTAGTFANGSGNLIYTITGTPATDGTAEFAINIGGQNCTLSIPVASASFTCGTSTVTFTYRGSSVTYGTVIGAGNRCWLDRNLGASQVATSSTDAAAYGDLFQWGRGDDGHQIRTSTITTILSNTDIPGHGNFITVNQNASPYDWRSPQNSNLWQGVNGVNNPCPTGFIIPSYAILNAELSSWGSNQNSIGAFASPLKLPLAGYRNGSNGSLLDVGTTGHYSTSAAASFFSTNLHLENNFASLILRVRANGRSVRCVKD